MHCSALKEIRFIVTSVKALNTLNNYILMYLRNYLKVKKILYSYYLMNVK